MGRTTVFPRQSQAQSAGHTHSPARSLHGGKDPRQSHRSPWAKAKRPGKTMQVKPAAYQELCYKTAGSADWRQAVAPWDTEAVEAQNSWKAEAKREQKPWGREKRCERWADSNRSVRSGSRRRLCHAAKWTLSCQGGNKTLSFRL